VPGTRRGLPCQLRRSQEVGTQSCTKSTYGIAYWRFIRREHGTCHARTTSTSISIFGLWKSIRVEVTKTQGVSDCLYRHRGSRAHRRDNTGLLQCPYRSNRKTISGTRPASRLAIAESSSVPSGECSHRWLLRPLIPALEIHLIRDLSLRCFCIGYQVLTSVCGSTTQQADLGIGTPRSSVVYRHRDR
jgi:hypothetical protein